MRFSDLLGAQRQNTGGMGMRYSAILDIGSSKIVCMVVSGEADGAIILHGLGTVEYDGYRFGSMPDKRALAEAIQLSVEIAQAESQKRIKEICVGVPTPFMLVSRSAGSVEINSRDGRIGVADTEYLMESSLGYSEPEGYSLIHSTPFHYVVDGTDISGSPIGLPAKLLEAEVSHSYVDDKFKSLVTAILRQMGITVDMFVSAALATAYFTIDEAAAGKSAILVDCGGTHSDVSLISENALVACECVGMGGEHFTSDLCYGLRLPRSVADDIKRRYVFGLDYGDTAELVRIPGEGVFEIEHSLIQLILESRAEEICELIGKCLQHVDPTGSAPVWLVGGGMALMRGAGEFLAKQTGRTVSVSMPHVTRHSTVGYATAFGLADFALFRCGKSSVLKSTGRRLRRSFERNF